MIARARRLTINSENPGSNPGQVMINFLKLNFKIFKNTDATLYRNF